MAETRTLLVTGGAGFIGSALVRHLLAETDARVVTLDLLTYAAHPKTLDVVRHHSRHAFERANICDAAVVKTILEKYQPDGIIHLAAESHVDRSIDDAENFVKTNVVGTWTLLEYVTRYWKALPSGRRERFRFHHVSTDEVFGELGKEGAFTEDSRYAPSSPYSASKASADHFVRAWNRTYGLPTVLSNGSNNYGPYQFPEKLIPLMIVNGVQGLKLPVYAKGENVRDWLHVEDHARALWMIFARGRIGETYNVSGRSERRNIDVVQAICSILDETRPKSPHAPHARLISFVKDRPGHDWRYAVDATKLTNELDWRPRFTFEEGLRATVEWYLDNAPWWQGILDGSYRRQQESLAI
jgi:dTDP-glucose 4,6-dehydratase